MLYNHDNIIMFDLLCFVVSTSNLITGWCYTNQVTCCAEVLGGQTLPPKVLYDVCASMQHGIATHICHRVQRAIEYVKLKNLVPPDKQTLVGKFD